MKKGKYQTGASKRLVVLALALVLLLGCGIGGTIAFLMDTSNTVTNTFTVGDIAIELKEHELNEAGTGLTDTETEQEDSYKIVPGTNQPKDPFVRFTEESEACWLFVKVEEKNNATVGNMKYVTYGVDLNIWTPLAGHTGIYYIDLTAGVVPDESKYDILADDQVHYVDGLTKEMIAALDKNTEGQEGYGTIEKDEMPQLIFTAYAVQKEAATNAEEAWALVKGNPA